MIYDLGDIWEMCSQLFNWGVYFMPIFIFNLSASNFTIPPFFWDTLYIKLMYFLIFYLFQYPGFNEDGLMFDFENTRKYKYFCRVWMGPFLAVVQAFHPDTVRHIIKCTCKSVFLAQYFIEILNVWRVSLLGC